MTARSSAEGDRAVLSPVRRRRPFHRALSRALAIAAAALAVARPLPGQSAGPAAPDPDPTGVLSGRVVNAETLEPLVGAIVLLRRVSDPGNRSGGGWSRTVVTDARGEYRFRRLPAARYSLSVRRSGYFPGAIEVDLQSQAATRVSLGLEVEPVLLPPVEVMGTETPPYVRSSPPPAVGEGIGRAAVARIRQEEYLATDARELTQGEVVEAVTLAETDLFRALQRLPGVGTRDDYTATLWTRGASWDQTRVYFDGLPLYNPTHAGWLFSAVNPDGVGQVAFHPGTRSARWGEGAAGVLDLRSRSGGGSGEIRGRGELSLASLRMALDGRLPNAEVDWMVAARRTYVDALTSVYGELTRSEEAKIPYDFSDVIARVDGRLVGDWHYVVSGIAEQDRLRGDIPGILRSNRGRWGNVAARVAVGGPVGPLEASFFAGGTNFRTAILGRERIAGEPVPTEGPTLPPLESMIRHRRLAVELGSRAGWFGPHEWAVGYESLRDTVGYRGPLSLVQAITVLSPEGGAGASPELDYRNRMQYHVLWGDYRWTPSPTFAAEAGLRVEIGDSVLNGGERRTAPRFGLRWTPLPGTNLSAGFSRTYQYTQDIAPVAGPLGPQLHLTHLWVLAQPARYPAVRSDISTLGVERWFGEGWLGSANYYFRRASGVAVANPDSGRVVPDRPPDAVAVNRASGIELSLRRLGNVWTASAGYAYGVSSMRATLEQPEGDTLIVGFPSQADVRHSLDGTVLGHVGSGVRLGAAVTYGSGVPYTRLILPEEGSTRQTVIVDRAGKLRTPSYFSVDLLADITKDYGSWTATGYLQLRNALGRENRVTYAGSRCEDEFSGSTAGCGKVQDFFESGIPRLPLIGVRVTF